MSQYLISSTGNDKEHDGRNQIICTLLSLYNIMSRCKNQIIILIAHFSIVEAEWKKMILNVFVMQTEAIDRIETIKIRKCVILSVNQITGFLFYCCMKSMCFAFFHFHKSLLALILF